MRTFFCMAGVVLLASAISVNAAVVGEPSPLADGSVDGWSGVTVMNGYGGLPAGEMVTTASYYAAAGRADGSHVVQPLIAKEEGGAFTIWDVGPTSTPTTEGDNSVAWGSKVVPDDGNVYHPAFWQWNEGVDDTDGGMVAFGDAGGSGMFQQNEDGTSYVPAIGDELAAGHASAAGGRAYQFNYTTAVPEPGTIVLAVLAVFPLAMGLRRRLKK